jgi:hypothetical protein
MLMSRLTEFLRDEVLSYNEELTEQQVRNIVSGLEYYINGYLAEQIPEQIENELD